MHLMVRTARRPTSVLLLETAGRSRDTHAIILMTNGYDVDCTASADQAWRMWKSKRPDLVLIALDVHDRRLLGVVVKIRRAHTSQLVRVLRPRLCALYFNGNLVQAAMSSDDVLVAAEAGDRDVPANKSEGAIA